MAEDKWSPALSQHAFQHRISFHLEYPDNTEIAFNTGVNALGCLRCTNVFALKACSNCGNNGFKVSVESDRVIGLFCNRCRRVSPRGCARIAVLTTP